MKTNYVHPRDKANYISKVTLWWIVDLLWRGKLNPLNHEDLDPVEEKECADLQIKRLEEIWRNEKISANQQKRKPKLWKAMLRYFTWEDYGFLSFTCFLSISGGVLCRYALVMLLNAVMTNEEHGVITKHKYLFYVWGLILGVLVENFGTRHYNLKTPNLGIRFRGAIVGLIYQKMLKCSKTTINAGEVMELVCNDTQRLVTMAERFVPFFIRVTIRCLIYIGWLALLFGWKIIPGLLVFGCLSLFRILVTEVDVNLRRNISQVAEKRLGYLREVLTIIHSVKLNCLEHVYEEKIKNTRWQEIRNKVKRWIILSFSFSFTTCGQHLSTFGTLMVFIFTYPSLLTVNNIFTMMLLFFIISHTICLDMPVSIYFSTDILTGLTRIQGFLERYNVMDLMIEQKSSSNPDGGHLEFHETSTNETTFSEVVSHAPYVWLNNISCKLHALDVPNLQTNDALLLKDISIKISSQGLIIITGAVGSGKSSLLASVLHGELHIVKGSIQQSGNLAYVSDTPWVFPGTVRENILFGLAYDEKWYLETIKACQLEQDFKKFPEQDLSRIGEHGATLSGGQRTRVALARAVYSRADIYLLDDPFSSLDVKVAEDIFKHVLKGLLSRRIVFLVTHTYLSEADYIVKLNEGMVVAQGTVEEVKKKMPEIKIVDKKDYKETDEECELSEKDDDQSQVEQLREAEEDRKVGSISFKVYAKYFMYGAPAFVLLLVLLVIGAAQGLTMWIDFQVASLPNFKEQKENFPKAFLKYTISLMVAVLFTILAKSCIILLPIRANYNIHNKMVSCLLQAPTYFYAINPAGRILNRFSQDINNLDDLLPYSLMIFFQGVTISLAAIILCLVTNVFLTPIILITIITCYGVSRFFFTSAMDIKRLMSEAGGPLYSHFSNTMEGLRTIRVHKRQKKFTDMMLSHIDRHHQAMFAYYTAVTWFGLTIDFILIAFLAIVTTIELYSATDSSTAVIAALAILYSFNAAVYIPAIVRNAVEVEAQMTSAERILAYTEIKPEEGCKIKKQPPKKWPEGGGGIQFKNVSLRHYKNGPKVLNDLSFQINASEKIGIIGRTGAGKSSLVAALMRIGETKGNIIIDSLSIQDLNLQSTRQRISVISQSPVLFTGSIRENLNPTGEFNDSEIWNVLDQMQLSNLVGSLPNKLGNMCTGGGSNFSVGERQLFHLARVLLKQNKVIIFDEATGKVDKKTTEQIQKVIHGALQDCTVLTISHRMAEIQDCNRVMVLDEGLVVEFDKPDALLKKENALFTELTKIANEA